MRSVCRTVRRLFDTRRTAPGAASLPAARSATVAAALATALAAALLVAAPAARAQSTADTPASADAVAATVADPQVESQVQTGAYAATDDDWLAGDAKARPARALADAGQLDDQTLSRQRGGAVGMVMVAATPQLLRGNGVTLWDEIAPPVPLPIPVDASQAAQGNIASYTRR